MKLSHRLPRKKTNPTAAAVSGIKRVDNKNVHIRVTVSDALTFNHHVTALVDNSALKTNWAHGLVEMPRLM